MVMPIGWMLPLSLGAAVLADQALKGLVVARLGEVDAVRLTPHVRIRAARTHRTFAGRLGMGPIALSILWLACLASVILVAPRAGHFDAPISRVALGLALGGAASNILDVLVRKSVVDYLEVGKWPAFNLADAAIVVGVILAIATR